MEIITLTKDELKKIKKDLFDGAVMTDGCFCGEAVVNFRDDLYVMMNFNCRKSGGVNNPFYEVTRVHIGYNAEEKFPKGYIKQLTQLKENADFYFTIEELDGYKVFEDDTWNLYLINDEIQFDEESLLGVQKALFKYYKKNFISEYVAESLKFKDAGIFTY